VHGVKVRIAGEGQLRSLTLGTAGKEDEIHFRENDGERVGGLSHGGQREKRGSRCSSNSGRRKGKEKASFQRKGGICRP